MDIQRRETTPDSDSPSVETTELAEPSRLSFIQFLKIFEYKSVSLENKGSVARDHLANERTFLAWLRTSLSFITLGIGVTQLFRLEQKTSKVETPYSWIPLSDDQDNGNIAIRKYGKALGSTFVVLGIITLLYGLGRFIQVQSMLTKSYYPVARLSMVLLILMILAVVSVTFVMVLKTSI